jgi:hypothetical protein
MTTLNFTVGQTVILIQPHSRAQSEVIIEKIGRKLAYVTVHGRSVPFYLDTGYQSNTQYTAMRIATPETLAAEEERTAAIARLRELGVVSGDFGGFKVSTATLHNLITVLENPA